MEPQTIWNEFRDKLRRGELTEDDCIRHSQIDYAAVFCDERMQSLKNFIVKQENPRIEQGEEKLVFTLKSSEKDEIRLDFVVLIFEDHELLVLYDVTGHLRPRISLEEYRELFEDEWKDRARCAGWNVRFEYEGYDTRMILEAVSSDR